MTALRRLLAWYRYPPQNDTARVSAMVAAQWAGIARRTATYAEGYRDRPGDDGRSQRRAEWIAVQLPAYDDVLEVGCGMGRNLAAVRRRQQRADACPADWWLCGIDICAEAIREAQRALPGGDFRVANLLEPIVLPCAAVVLAVGVLCHLPPPTLPGVLARLLMAADPWLVFVEEEGRDEVVKGPSSWHPERATGDYCLWRPNLVDRLGDLGITSLVITPMPRDLHAPGATRMLTVRR